MGETPAEEAAVNASANETVEHVVEAVPTLSLNGTMNSTASAADLLGNSSDANATDANATGTESSTSLVLGTDVSATSSLLGTSSSSTTDSLSSTSTSTTLGGAAPPAIELPSASSYSSFSSLSSPLIWQRPPPPLT